MLALSTLRARDDARNAYRELPPSGRAEADTLQRGLRARGTVVDLSMNVVVARPCPDNGMETSVPSTRPNTVVPEAFDNNSAKEFVANIIEIDFGQHRSKAKAVSSHTAEAASPRTVEAWLRKESAPSLAAFLNLLLGPKPLPALQAEVRRLLAERAGQVGDDSRAIHEMHRMLRQMSGEP